VRYGNDIAHVTNHTASKVVLIKAREVRTLFCNVPFVRDIATLNFKQLQQQYLYFSRTSGQTYSRSAIRKGSLSLPALCPKDAD
jgi:hypothetical protein